MTGLGLFIASFGGMAATLPAQLLLPSIGWRGMLMLGVIPALLILYIRRNVPESPAWEAERKAGATR